MIELAPLTFETAWQASKRGIPALERVDQAIKAMPDDPSLHEFRLILFALRRCDEAAGELYAVLSIQPGGIGRL